MCSGHKTANALRQAFILPSLSHLPSMRHTDAAQVHLLSYTRGKIYIHPGCKIAKTRALPVHRLRAKYNTGPLVSKATCRFVKTVITVFMFSKCFNAGELDDNLIAALMSINVHRFRTMYKVFFWAEDEYKKTSDCWLCLYTDEGLLIKVVML